ncbi:MAG: ABC transporter ATP-binding protein [Candidatus Nanopelagicales bacterium]
MSPSPSHEDRVNPTVEACAITLDYGAGQGVFDISFSTESGVTVLAGNNGAGKTTLMESLQGLRRPQSGSARILGMDTLRHRAQLAVQTGSVLQGVTPYPTAKPREFLTFLSRLYPTAREANELMDIFQIPDSRSIKTLSGGEVQRLNCAAALVGAPKVVFLDEPTAGLDPGGRADLYGVLREQALQGVVMLITTHLTEDIDQLADRALVLTQGQLTADISKKSIASTEALTFNCRTNLPTAQLLSALPLESTARETVKGRYLITAPSHIGSEVIATVEAWCAQNGTQAENLHVGAETLSSLVLAELSKDSGQIS